MRSRSRRGTGTPEWRLDLARAWAAVLDPTAYAPISISELEREVGVQLARLLAALRSNQVDVVAAEDVGGWLVRQRLTGHDSLQCTIEVLGNALLPSARGPAAQRRGVRVAMLLGALAKGYANALRVDALDQHEQLGRALLTANQRIAARLRATESRFREVFTSSAVGIAITDETGRFTETNPALATILGVRPDELAGRRLRDFLSEGCDEAAKANSLRKGPDRAGERCELTRDDGDTAWVYLATSSLADGAQVTMVQDLSEIQLLQDRLGHQLVHDALTGLPNRQHFTSRLERILGQADPAASLTLCCIGLDAFSLVNSGLGHETGDELLRAIARRLKAVMADERALVARTGGDEFAVLIEDTPTTPDVSELVKRIQDDLGEVHYLGGQGVSVGATIGVDRRTAGKTSSKDFFRAADFALHQAKKTGKRQWSSYDPHQDAAVREVHQAVLGLASGAENGEVGLVLQPVVRLADGRAVAAAGVLSWNPAEPLTVLPAPTVELAEQGGLSVALLPSLVTEAFGKVAALTKVLGDDATVPVLRIHLSRLQSGDADLSAVVNEAIAATGVRPQQVEVALDTGALLSDQGDTRDNLAVLHDIGFATALHSFSGGIREFGVLEQLSVRSVVLANPNLAAEKPGALTTAATAQLVGELRRTGFDVAVDGVADAAEAEWWRTIGVTSAWGPAFTGLDVVEEIADVFLR